tara:strand:- start:3439 stop:3882 length:444 start_codon:yes stop_codon:yes gene_type:complete
MKKADLKRLIKPLVKECIHEVLIEEGVLSNVVSEVAKGMQGNLVTETKAQKRSERLFDEKHEMQHRKQRQDDARAKMKEHRKKLLEAVSSDAYNGVDLFEGTTPMSNYEAAPQPQGSVDLGAPNDSGVDISSLLGGATEVWKGMNRK